MNAPEVVTSASPPRSAIFAHSSILPPWQKLGSDCPRSLNQVRARTSPRSPGGGPSARFLSFDQEALSAGEKLSVLFDMAMQLGEPPPVFLGTEVGHGPRDLAEEVNDRGDIEEHRLEGLLAKVDHLEPCVLGVANGLNGIPAPVYRLR